MRKGIPTLFQGVRMRSRTEARWAALFTEIGWQWSYEPMDLSGYLPDFSVPLGNQECIIEVKATDEDFAIAESKIEVSGWEGMAIVVGHTLDGRCCGRFRDWDGVEWQWGELELFRCLSWDCVSPLQVEGSWHCRCCGAREDHRGDFDVEAAFARAANRVQWRSE